MKTKLLLASLAMTTCAASAWAELPTDGEYLLQNVETGYYLGGGLDWGTHATLIGKPQWFALAVQADGAYTLDSHQYNNETNHFLGTGLYVDAAAANWTFTENEDGTFTINNAGNYISGNGENAAIATVTDATAASAQWKLITKEDIIAAQENASYENPVDVTAFIKNPEFKRNGNTKYYPTWTVTGFDGTGTPANYSEGQNGNVASIAESYHSSNGFSFSQEITGLKAGYYKLGASAFYREDGSETVYPYIFANDKQSTFPKLTGSEGNMPSAYQSFLAGNYAVDPITVKVAEGETLTVGVKGEATDKWNIWGEFSLSYLGSGSVAEKQYLAVVEEVEAYVSKEHDVNAELLATLTKALEEKGALKDATDDEYDAAVEELSAALKAAEANETAYASVPANLDFIADFVKTTNVYTAEALAAYYTTPKEKYENKTLTTEEANAVQDPNAQLGWHQSNTVDDLLLSAWGVKDYDSALYINTWSTEGNTDGSDFRVPFFEYWTGSASLGANTWTATLTNLEPNSLYSVSALVRLQQKDKTTPKGVYYQVGVNVTDSVLVTGTQIGTSDLFLDTYKVIGTSDAEGKLTISFIVAAGNNVSWLSFKNLVYAEDYDGVPTGVAAPEAKGEDAPLSIYDLSGRKLNGLKKGINIVNGAKVLVK
jgi:hypothetical protein